MGTRRSPCGYFASARCARPQLGWEWQRQLPPQGRAHGSSRCPVPAQLALPQPFPPGQCDPPRDEFSLWLHSQVLGGQGRPCPSAVEQTQPGTGPGMVRGKLSAMAPSPSCHTGVRATAAQPQAMGHRLHPTCPRYVAPTLCAPVASPQTPPHELHTSGGVIHPMLSTVCPSYGSRPHTPTLIPSSYGSGPHTPTPHPPPMCCVPPTLDKST